MKKKIMKFLEALENYGECFFSTGNVKQDYNTIKNVLNFQGYWSGTAYRLYFDNDFNLTSVEPRF